MMRINSSGRRSVFTSTSCSLFRRSTPACDTGSLTSILITTIPRQKTEAHEVRQRYSNNLHVKSVFLVFVGKAYVITTANNSHKLQRMPSMKDKPTVVWLEDVRIEDVPSVGGKGASLGEMINAEIPVPLSLIHIRAHETPEHLVCRLLLEK